MFGHDDKDKEEKDQAELGSVTSDGQGSQDWQHPGSPISDDSSSGDDKQDDATSDSVITPSEDKPPIDEPDDKPEPEEPSETAPASSNDEPANDLIDLKQEALSKLGPLVGHLDQSPEERFRTLMMMIQASDDQSKIKEAYDTALDISDEKERAQALLDIINEINYFTQSSKSE
jgi:hypothetical protein